MYPEQPAHGTNLPYIHALIQTQKRHPLRCRPGWWRNHRVGGWEKEKLEQPNWVGPFNPASVKSNFVLKRESLTRVRWPGVEFLRLRYRKLAFCSPSAAHRACVPHVSSRVVRPSVCPSVCPLAHRVAALHQRDSVVFHGLLPSGHPCHPVRQH